MRNWRKNIKIVLNHTCRLLLVFFLCLAGFSLTAGAEENPALKWAQTLLTHQKANRCLPRLAHLYPGLDIEGAYGVQKLLVKQLVPDGKIPGFKAGLTSKKIQQLLGIGHPVAGVLLSNRNPHPHRLDAGNFNKLFIEMEIGFIIGSTIDKPLKNEKELKKHIKAIAPVIEFPDTCFEGKGPPSPADIIAANVGAREYIEGKEFPTAETANLDDITVVLYLNDVEMARGKGSDALGGQWQAALWLANTMIKRGYTLEPGQLLITGALGKMLPGLPGEYTADYGNMGKLTFVIQ